MHYMVPLFFYTHKFVIKEVLHYIKKLYKFSHKWIKSTLHSFSHGLINFRECPPRDSIWIMSIVICLMLFETRMINSIIIKGRILVLVLWSYRSPEHVDYWIYNGHPIWTRCPISFKHVSFQCTFLDPHLTTYHSNRDVQIKPVLDLGTSTSKYC